jgi:hypothetical protein
MQSCPLGSCTCTECRHRNPNSLWRAGAGGEQEEADSEMDAMEEGDGQQQASLPQQVPQGSAATAGGLGVLQQQGPGSSAAVLAAMQPVGPAPPSAEADEGPLDKTYLELFLLKYLCSRLGCLGTMAPTSPGTGVLECSVCGAQAGENDFLEGLEAAGAMS